MYWTIFSAILGVLSLTSCLEPTHDSSNLSSTLKPVYDTDQDLAVLEIFSNNCNSCHGPSSPGYGNISYLNDIALMIQNGIVVPGNQSGSTVYTEIESGDMPQSGSLSAEDQQIVYDWIISLEGRDTSGNEESAPTFSEINSKIIQPKCVSCHGSSGGISLETHSDVMDVVWAGSPSASLLWQKVEDGSMPKGASPLNQEDVDDLADWISEGALNN